MREYCKCGERGNSGVSQGKKKTRERDPDYWQERLNAEECTAAFQTAIATLIEDASEITLALYVIVGHGQQENIIGQFCPLHRHRRPPNSGKNIFQAKMCKIWAFC